MSLVSQLLMVVSTYRDTRKLSLSRVSTLLFNDGKCLARLERGGDLNTGTYEAAMAWLSAHWPEGADWPAEVPRPVAAPPAPPSPAPLSEVAA